MPKSADELRQQRDLLLDCYVHALRNAAHYAIELDPQITPPHRQYLSALAEEVARGGPVAIEESRSTLRSILRDYRDRAGEYLAHMRNELSATVRALRGIVEALTHDQGEHEQHLHDEIVKLRLLARTAKDGTVRDSVATITAAIEGGLEHSHRQNQLTIARFLAELRSLHKRIDALEAAAAIDDLAKVLQRSELEQLVRKHAPLPYCLLLVRANGLREATTRFGAGVGAELTTAFIRRLKNTLPPNVPIARWAEEDFAALLDAPKADVAHRGTFIAAHLGGTYAFLQGGKTVRPVLTLRINVVDADREPAERVLDRAKELLP